MSNPVTMFAITLVSFISVATTPLAEMHTGSYQFRGVNALSHQSSHFSYEVGVECEVGPSINNVGLGRHTVSINERFEVPEKCTMPVHGGYGALKRYGPYAPAMLMSSVESSFYSIE